ncbi:hypothetical protein JTL53_35820, partial [Pseudomonas aeruginosa]|nr:hypothetical protein [Pseudomonas aeruginosa]
TVHEPRRNFTSVNLVYFPGCTLCCAVLGKNSIYLGNSGLKRSALTGYRAASGRLCLLTRHSLALEVLSAALECICDA